VVRRLRALAAAAATMAAAGCGDFEDKAIVIDLRVMAMTASPPEIVAPFDPAEPLEVELADTEICALIADPADSRALTVSMEACGPTSSDRCDDPERPILQLGELTIEDPEEAATPPRACLTLEDGLGLLTVLQDSISEDDLLGFGGVAVRVVMRVRPSDTDPGDPAEIYAFKRMRFAPQEPPERVANTNPRLDGLCVATIADADDDPVVPDACAAHIGPDDRTLPIGRCRDIEPLVMAAGEILEIFPVEPDGVREDYVLPTFDGGSRAITENLTYAWHATAGAWSAGGTGGPRDGAGNEARLETRFTAPADPEVIGDGLDISLWVVQRDERGGIAWYESCVHVEPE
jgi:hypothetical protein